MAFFVISATFSLQKMLGGALQESREGDDHQPFFRLWLSYDAPNAFYTQTAAYSYDDIFTLS